MAFERLRLLLLFCIAAASCSGGTSSSVEERAARACDAVDACGGQAMECEAVLGVADLSEECVEQIETAACSEHEAETPSYADVCFPRCDETECEVLVSGCNSVIQRGSELTDFECGTVVIGTVGGREFCVVSDSCSISLVEPNCLERETTYSCFPGCATPKCQGEESVTFCRNVGGQQRRFTLRCDAVCEQQGRTTGRCGAGTNGEEECQCE